jgi:hypothetical protein
VRSAGQKVHLHCSTRRPFSIKVPTHDALNRNRSAALGDVAEERWTAGPAAL